jgi:hypothetical protein
MKIYTAFPSKYLKAADLQNGRVTVVIDKVVMETIANDKRAVIYFKGTLKGLVLNKTNASMIVEIAGSDDTADWAGIEVVLYTTRVDFQARRVDAIRIDRPSDRDKSAGRSGDDELAF